MSEKSKMGLSSKNFSDITSMLYLPEDNMLIVGTSDSVIKFYDESDSEDNNMLKFFMGGHQESSITALEYQSVCDFLASGSENGIVTLWDVGQGKLEASFKLQSGKITGVKFLEFYNVLLSSSMDGTICGIGHRPILNKYKNQCIFKLLIYEWSGLDLYSRMDKLVPVTGLQTRCSVEKLSFHHKINNPMLEQMLVKEPELGFGGLKDDLKPIKPSEKDQNQDTNIEDEYCLL